MKTITVTGTLFSSPEKQAEYEAQHDTYQYIEKRLAYLDLFFEHVNVATLSDIVSEQFNIDIMNIVQNVYDRLKSLPMTDNEQLDRAMRASIQNHIITTNDDEQIRDYVDEQLSSVDEQLNLIKSMIDDIINLTQVFINISNEQQRQISELRTTLHNSNKTISDDVQMLSNDIKSMNNKIIYLQQKTSLEGIFERIVKLENENKDLKNKINLLMSRATFKSDRPKLQKRPQNQSQNNSCCDMFSSRYSNIYKAWV